MSQIAPPPGTPQQTGTGPHGPGLVGPDREPTARAPRRRVSLRELLRAARTPRMLVLLAVIVVAALVCVRLGAWQIDRAFSRAQAARDAEQAALAQADPVPLETVLSPGDHVMGVDVGVPLTVVGSYEADGQVLVPGRAVAGEEGYLVVTPLWTEGGAWLPVVRGFTTDPDAAAVAEVPAGELELTGAMTAGEAYLPAPLVAGQVPSISPAYFAGTWGLPIYNAYFVLADGGDLLTVPRPVLDGGGGVDVRNLAYAAEWYVFGAFVLVVWYRLVRDEALERREDLAD